MSVVTASLPLPQAGGGRAAFIPRGELLLDKARWWQWCVGCWDGLLGWEHDAIEKQQTPVPI